MLRRLQRANAVLLDPRNSAPRAEIEKAHEKNLPIIEAIVREGSQDNGRCFVKVYRLHAPNLDMPGRLPASMLSFADEVVIAWLSSTSKERANAIRIASFGWGCNSEAYAFFGRELEGIVHQAKPLARWMRQNGNDSGNDDLLRAHLLEVTRRLTVGFSPLL